jgi:hypothetical protein
MSLDVSATHPILAIYSLKVDLFYVFSLSQEPDAKENA